MSGHGHEPPGGFNADNQQTSPGTFAYDGNGNPTTYKGASLTFDVENRMTSVQVGINAQSNGYRSDGLRAWKGWNVVLPLGENDAVALGTYFYYDGGFPALETNSSGTITAINVFAPDGLVARKQSGNWRHYQFDAQGSVMHRLRDDETVINNSKYDAYGMHVSVPFPVADAFGYNGRWGYTTDDETGLILCMHRYYDAASGRWLTRDPIGYSGGIGLYGYCLGNPIGSVDPEGKGIYQWLYTGDWNAPDEVYRAALDQAWSTLTTWVKHFGRRNGFEAPGVAVVIGPVPKAIPQKLGLVRNIRNEGRSWCTSGLRVASQMTRNKHLISAAKFTKAHHGELWIMVEAIIAWQATIDTLNDPDVWIEQGN